MYKNLLYGVEYYEIVISGSRAFHAFERNQLISSNQGEIMKRTTWSSIITAKYSLMIFQKERTLLMRGFILHGL